jgi:UDP-2,3-diacylglucosamine pyrophosphatase LpxH
MNISSVDSTDGGRILHVRGEIETGETLRLFFFSDLHFDGQGCNRERLKRDLAHAAEKGYILIIGDIFDAMQGRYDPRRSYSGMRREYAEKLLAGGSYFDLIVEDAAKFFVPFASKILMFSYGNHETSVLRHSDTDLLQRLAAMLNLGLKDWRVHVGAYAGYVYFGLKTRSTVGRSLVIRYHHGYGGDAPVTRGVIQTNRQAVDAPDADVVVNGHNHQQYVVVVPRERFFLNKGKPFIKNEPQFFIRTPSYAVGRDGMDWETQTGKPPRVAGYCVLEALCQHDDFRLSAHVVAE